MIVKLLLIAAICSLGALMLRGTTARYLALRRFGGLVLGAGGVFAILFPDILTTLANLIGVGRGSDLVLYATVVAFLFTTLGLHQRIQTLESRILELTRDFAIREKVRENVGANHSAGDTT